MESDVPDEIKKLADALTLTRVYNNMTGANVTHWEIQQLGLIERVKILSAIKVMK